MPLNFMQRGAVWMAGVGEALSGVQGKLRRNGADTGNITAIPARRSSEDYGADGTLIVSTHHDWLVDPSLLVIDGVSVMPERGDIWTTEAGETFVVVPDEAENCWRWMDHYRQRIRFHTIERRATGEDA